MFDVKELEAEVDKEISDDALKLAKVKLISKRKEIGAAKQIVRNFEREYDVLLLEITDEVNG